jgi:hypothetical protein
MSKGGKKPVKIHLSKNGTPLCSCDARVRDFSQLNYVLTTKFDEVTCQSCKNTITKLSRTQGYASA